MSQNVSSLNNVYDSTNDKNLIQNQINIQETKKLNEINKDNSRKAYIKILENVIENSDVILEVLDTRDPLNCRSIELENLIRNKSSKFEKKIIFVLNKIDLVPIENALQWQKYLSREYATVLFKSNTQTQSSNLSQSNLFDKNFKNLSNSINIQENVNNVLKGNASVGTEELLNILKNYSRTDSGAKTNIVVGVIGRPNVGKSSLINSLTRGKNVSVSSKPGFTKGMQEIILDSNIKLLDCPGVVMNVNNENVLQNVLKVEDIKEPIDVVMKIVDKVGYNKLLEIYNIKLDNLKGNELTCEKFLYLVGDKLKKIKKGGLVDLDKSARLVLNDWNSGKIPYYTVPPGVDKELFENNIFNNSLSSIKNKSNKDMELD